MHRVQTGGLPWPFPGRYIEPMHPALKWILHQLLVGEIELGTLMVFLDLLALAAEHAGEASCQVSVSQIARGTGLGTRAVEAARGELERRRWVRVQRESGADGRHAANRYHILRPPPGWRVGAPPRMHPAPKWILEQYRARRWSRGTLLVYLVLLSQSRVIEEWVCCALTVAKLGEETGLCKRSVRYAVDDLQDRMLVTVRSIPLWSGCRTARNENLYFVDQVPPAGKSRVVRDDDALAHQRVEAHLLGRIYMLPITDPGLLWSASKATKRRIENTLARRAPSPTLR